MSKTKTDKANSLTFCKYLRAKNPYGLTEGGSEPWHLPFESNTICWCVKSTGGIGPDNGLVSPQKCVSGRSCFKAREQ